MKKMPRRHLRLPVDSILFFLCVYLYVWMMIEPPLIYHGFGSFTTYPAFPGDREFLRNSLSYSGGIVEYVGGCLSQLYYVSWLGALVITAIALLIYTATRILIRLSTAETLKPLCTIPVVFLLMLYNRYDNQVNAFIALLVSLWFLIIYEKMAERNSAARAIVFLVMFALLYHLVGGTGFVFALLAMMYEFLTGKRRVLSAVILAATIGFYVLIRFTFYGEADFIPLQELEVTLSHDPWINILAFGLYGFYPLVFFAAGIWRISERNYRAKWIVETALPLVVLAAGMFVSFDSTKKKLVQIDYFAHKKMWPEVLRTAGKVPPEDCDVFCLHDINRALYHTGRLGDDMFAYPQQQQALILTGSQESGASARLFLKRSLFLLQLGYIGIAERDAFEYLELAGSTPRILEQLARIKMVKGQVEAAKVFLQALSKDLIFGSRGREMLGRLEQDPQLANDPWVQHIRSIAPDKDSISFDVGVGEFFQLLLDKNPKNKLAFEYLMAVYLLTGQVDQIVANIGHLRSLGYERIPRCYQEGILIHIGTGNTKINLQGWKLSPEIARRILEIDKICKLQGGNQNERGIRNALGSDYADSYFLYYLFGSQGARR